MSINIAKKDEKTKEQRMQDYIKSVVAVEQAMEPFKEQKRDLRKSYVDNGWLSKDEMSLLVKAYRLVKDDTDFEQLQSVYNKISFKGGA